MGAGIAQVMALAGHSAVLCDIQQKVLDAAQSRIQASLDQGVARQKISEEKRDQAWQNLHFATDSAEPLASADVVLEAIPENLALKKSIFADLSDKAEVAWLLGTNTSALSITEIAAATACPEKVLGLHFFNPPPIMKLVEVVRASRTSEAVVRRAREFIEACGKTPIIVSDTPGFATSRLGLVIGLEAMRMVEQRVACPADIDAAMELGYRHALGPLKTTDYVGLEVRLAIAEHLFHEIGEAFRPPMILRRMVRAGKLGRKSGEGFYRWSENGECLGANDSF